MQIPEVVYVKKRFAVSGGAADRMERAVEGRKEEQDGKAVSKSNLDAMDEGRSPIISCETAKKEAAIS